MASPPSAADDEHALDLRLICHEGESVLACSKLLRDATRSLAVKEIIDKLRDEHPSASAACPMELTLADDKATLWQVVWKLVEKPLAKEPADLTWLNLEDVIRLADKYHLLSALQLCQCFALSALAGNSVVESPPFGAIKTYERSNGSAKRAVTFELRLPLLEVLLKAELHMAFEGLTKVFMQRQTDLVEQLVAKHAELTKMLSESWSNATLRDTSAVTNQLAVQASRHITAAIRALAEYKESGSGTCETAKIVHDVIYNRVLDLNERGFKRNGR